MNILNLKEEPRHLSVLAQWHHKQWAYLNPEASLEKRIARMRACLNDALIPGIFIAKEGEQLLGSAAIVEHDMDTHRELTPWLASVFVAPAYRRRGVGTALVRHVMQQAQAAGIPVLYLFTPDQEAFYRKLGWQTLGRESYRGHDVTIMQLQLER